VKIFLYKPYFKKLFHIIKFMTPTNQPLQPLRKYSSALIRVDYNNFNQITPPSSRILPNQRKLREQLLCDAVRFKVPKVPQRIPQRVSVPSQCSSNPTTPLNKLFQAALFCETFGQTSVLTDTEFREYLKHW
jgi:hypothetical protein